MLAGSLPNMIPVLILLFLLLLVLFVLFYKKPARKLILAQTYKDLLEQHVLFYKRLNETKKLQFEEKVKEFLTNIRIDGVNTSVEELDKLLVASSAIIPVFYFKKWAYYNLKNVLLYPGSFNKDEFQAEGYEQNTLGMIGNGPMQHVMILSKPALHGGFRNAGKHNTGIHEFVHLLDKEDGDVDGLPEALLKRDQNKTWLELVNNNIKAIVGGDSDIDIYGATNKAEFFSVASEYFFNNPVLFKENHPDLYNIMQQMFEIPD